MSKISLITPLIIIILLIIIIIIMWGMKTAKIPVVIGALGLMKKGMERFTNPIAGNINIYTVQKVALLGTAHILWRVLSIKCHFPYSASGP